MVDRSSAIAHAIANAGPTDVVLIAGKGTRAIRSSVPKGCRFRTCRRHAWHLPGALAQQVANARIDDHRRPCARAVGARRAGRTGGDGRVGFSSVSTDSRTLPGGALFVALSGERFDGHDYVARARETEPRARWSSGASRSMFRN